MPILTVQIDPTGTQSWATYYRYDLNGRQILKAHPSAVSGYDETYDDLVNYTGGAGSLLRAASGLIESTVYYTTTGSGAAAGYVQYEQVQQGQGGAAVTVRQYTYQGYVSNTVYPVASVTEYPVAGSTTPSNVTSFSYTYTGAVLTAKVTTFPAVLTTHNGSGAADSITEAFRD